MVAFATASRSCACPRRVQAHSSRGRAGRRLVAVQEEGAQEEGQPDDEADDLDAGAAVADVRAREAQAETSLMADSCKLDVKWDMMGRIVKVRGPAYR